MAELIVILFLLWCLRLSRGHSEPNGKGHEVEPKFRLPNLWKRVGLFLALVWRKTDPMFNFDGSYEQVRMSVYYAWYLAGRKHGGADLYIGGKEDPYLIRWYILPKNPWFNIYLHKMLRDDDDRALHDHPWIWGSLMLKGGYFEVQEGSKRYYKRGDFRVRLPRTAHRLVLDEGRECWTLFFTLLNVREWGFLCSGIPTIKNLDAITEEEMLDIQRKPTVPIVMDGVHRLTWKPRWVHWKWFTSGERGEKVGRGCD